jgi:hypothetical protein
LQANVSSRSNKNSNNNNISQASSINNIEKNIVENILEITSIHEEDRLVGGAGAGAGGEFSNDSHRSSPTLKNFADEKPSYLKAPIFRTSSTNSLLIKPNESSANKSLVSSIRDSQKPNESKFPRAAQNC